MQRNEIHETAQLGRDKAVRRPQHAEVNGAGHLLGQHGLQCSGFKGLLDSEFRQAGDAPPFHSGVEKHVDVVADQHGSQVLSAVVGLIR